MGGLRTRPTLGLDRPSLAELSARGRGRRRRHPRGQRTPPRWTRPTSLHQNGLATFVRCRGNRGGIASGRCLARMLGRGAFEPPVGGSRVERGRGRCRPQRTSSAPMNSVIALQDAARAVQHPNDLEGRGIRVVHDEPARHRPEAQVGVGQVLPPVPQARHPRKSLERLERNCRVTPTWSSPPEAANLAA